MDQHLCRSTSEGIERLAKTLQHQLLKIFSFQPMILNGFSFHLHLRKTSAQGNIFLDQLMFNKKDEEYTH